MLLDRDGQKPDPWRRPAAADFATATHRLTPLADAGSTPPAPVRLGVEIANTADADSLVPRFAELALIAIAFPAYADGRGLSLARRLRRLGYAGRLRAVGPLIPDQADDLAACGFDEIELPAASAARQSPDHWRAAFGAHAAIYQPGYAGAGLSILEARRAAAEARHA